MTRSGPGSLGRDKICVFCAICKNPPFRPTPGLERGDERSADDGCDLAAGRPNRSALPYPHHQAMLGSANRMAPGGVAGCRLNRIPGAMLKPASLWLWCWIAAATAIALYSGISLHLTGTLAPWAMGDARLGRPEGVARTAP